MNSQTTISLFAALLFGSCLLSAQEITSSNPILPGTTPLEMSGDIASQLVSGVDQFLLRELEKSTEGRAHFWRPDFTSPAAYVQSVETNRQRLAHILGVRDPRMAPNGFELMATTTRNAVVYRGPNFEALAVRWAAFGDVHGEGLLLQPLASSPSEPGTPRASVIAIPDADQTPEQLAGLVEGVPPESQYARRLAESGCRVLIPFLINREMGKPKVPHTTRGSGLSNREFLYRSAFELGRHLIGYEVQKVLAAVDRFSQENPTPTIGVIGWGEGGLISLYAAALDSRINASAVSGYFNDRLKVWQEPIDRNIFGLLEQFGDAELASLIAPRALIIEAARGPELVLPGKGGGAPAELITPKLEEVQREFQRAQTLFAQLSPPPRLELVISGQGSGPYGTTKLLENFLDALHSGAALAASSSPPAPLPSRFDPQAQLQRQRHELDRHNQALLAESPYVRQEFMKKLDFTSLEKYRESSANYREFFSEEIIGRFDHPLLEPKPRSRRAYDTPHWTGYEVVLDVFPDVIAYGILLMPKNLEPGEKRPVVVCQHGLEGRPQDIVAGDHPAYHDFAAKLAERGFITFSPQNLYIFQDRFRTLQRKANPLKKTLFSIITPQHQQILNWLKTLPFVAPERIAFYGLSYGGKTAMRVPALLSDYCLSICSADFNEWVWKNASSRTPYSYVWTGEYEIFEFDLGSTFNYAEMAALIAPRPFMVERGHFDGVAPDETVGHEFAKVRFLYAAKLGIPDHCKIEWFVGPHTINGRGTFDFLHHFLDWPKPENRAAEPGE